MRVTGEQRRNTATLGHMARQQQDRSDGTELGRFLRARRAQVTPADVGLSTGSGTRRTPGLRREELASLAGISIDYYVRLERGNEHRPSPPVVDALARGLRLSEIEHQHLFNIVARAGRSGLAPRSEPSTCVPPGTRLLVESLRPNPAYVVSRTGDLLAHNPSGLRLLAGIEEWPAERRNTTRFLFLHPGARRLFHDWEGQLAGCVARLRALAGTAPSTPDLVRLVDELMRDSTEFAHLWEHYDVNARTHGRKTYNHPEVGTLDLGYQSMQLEGTPGQRLVAYYAEPGSAEHNAFTRLDHSAEHATGTSG